MNNDISKLNGECADDDTAIEFIETFFRFIYVEMTFMQLDMKD